MLHGGHFRASHTLGHLPKQRTGMAKLCEDRRTVVAEGVGLAETGLR